MPSTSSVVAFLLSSSAFTASCNDRWCPDATGSPAQFHAPTQRRERRECVPHDCGASLLWSCAHVRVPMGDVQRDVTANPKRLLRSILRLA
jgi:hypothetical protein